MEGSTRLRLRLAGRMAGTIACRRRMAGRGSGQEADRLNRHRRILGESPGGDGPKLEAGGIPRLARGRNQKTGRLAGWPAGRDGDRGEVASRGDRIRGGLQPGPVAGRVVRRTGVDRGGQRRVAKRRRPRRTPGSCSSRIRPSSIEPEMVAEAVRRGHRVLVCSNQTPREQVATAPAAACLPSRPGEGA